MQRYGGVLIHRSRDADGLLEVVDQGDLRSLHFGTPDMQSRMKLANVTALMLDYTRTMLAPLLFMERPASVLILGLGGGSLVKFLWRHCPRCHIQAVERRESVIQLAHTYFHLPRHHRIAIHSGDAGDYLFATAAPTYDLILVDLFNAWGPAEILADESFLMACRERLAPFGAVSLNLWRSEQYDSTEAIAVLGEIFEGRLLELPVSGKYNYIVMGFRHFILKPPRRPLRGRAEALATEMNIDFPGLLKELRRYNRAIL